MRSLYEILEATKAGEKPDYDELRYALLAMAALSVFDSMALMLIATDNRDRTPLIISLHGSDMRNRSSEER